VAHPARLEDRRAADRLDAVAQSGAALAADQREREPLLEVLARLHAVQTLLGEELRPALELALVETVGVLGVELLDLVANRARRAQSPMTSR
jgi:hypothetical protein